MLEVSIYYLAASHDRFQIFINVGVKVLALFVLWMAFRNRFLELLKKKEGVRKSNGKIITIHLKETYVLEFNINFIEDLEPTLLHVLFKSNTWFFEARIVHKILRDTK